MKYIKTYNESIEFDIEEIQDLFLLYADGFNLKQVDDLFDSEYTTFGEPGDCSVYIISDEVSSSHYNEPSSKYILISINFFDEFDETFSEPFNKAMEKFVKRIDSMGYKGVIDWSGGYIYSIMISRKYETYKNI